MTEPPRNLETEAYTAAVNAARLAAERKAKWARRIDIAKVIFGGFVLLMVVSAVSVYFEPTDGEVGLMYLILVAVILVIHALKDLGLLHTGKEKFRAVAFWIGVPIILNLLFHPTRVEALLMAIIMLLVSFFVVLVELQARKLERERFLRDLLTESDLNRAQPPTP